MNRQLLAKELHGLRTIFFCITGLLIATTIFMCVTELPDENPFTPEKWLDDNGGAGLAIIALFAFMVGAGLFNSERDQGTLNFLDSLPLSRSRVFWTKTLAGWLVMVFLVGIGLLLDFAFGAAARTSLDGPWPWGFAGAAFVLQIVSAIYLLSVALVISFVRGWFALVAGLVFWAYLLARQYEWPWFALVDPMNLFSVGVLEGGVTLPWPEMGAQLGVTGILLLVAWAGFCRLGRNLEAGQAGRYGFWRAIGSGLKFLAPLVWIGALIWLVSRSEHLPDGLETETPAGEKAFGRLETKHYEFLFRSSQKADCEPLMTAADQIYDQVAGYLGAGAPPSRIVVDLASPVASHAAAQTNWTKIRLPIRPDLSFADRRRYLGHETTHVFIEQLGQGRLTGVFTSIRSLHEGLSTHVEETLFGDSESADRQRREVAGAWSRGRIPVELLVDDEKLNETRDPNLVYPVGAELARALIVTHGRQAPEKLLRALVRSGAPVGLKGAALWRDAMQVAGLSFERVSGAYEAACAEAATREKDFVATLPRLTATVKVENELIVITPTHTGAAPGRLVCAIETGEFLATPTRFLPRQKDGTFTLPRREFHRPQLRYLLGWKTDQVEMPVFEPWAGVKME